MSTSFLVYTLESFIMNRTNNTHGFLYIYIIHNLACFLLFVHVQMEYY